jgi:bis(5'-nucleosyl)-tetraphosphatase (symmetrical)
MATYAIGDVQGCFDELLALLKMFSFNLQKDKLWFTGDLVNRGPKSLEVLRFVMDLPNVVCVLGNHDLTLLALAYTDIKIKYHNLNSILSAPDCEQLLNWLRQRVLFYEDTHFDYVLVHAGIPPQWSVVDAKSYAQEVETLLRGENFRLLLENMFGNYPNNWSPQLTGWDRYRFIINALTRLRFCHLDGSLELSYKGKIHLAPPGIVPWYYFPIKNNNKKILFGHWAALEGQTGNPIIEALDTGCFWGGALTAMRLEDGKKFVLGCGH